MSGWVSGLGQVPADGEADTRGGRETTRVLGQHDTTDPHPASESPSHHLNQWKPESVPPTVEAWWAFLSHDTRDT